jgi:hypothetical protein
MAPVDFYRFASAIMELLEPMAQTQKLYFNSDHSIKVPKDKNVPSSPITGIAEF